MRFFNLRLKRNSIFTKIAAVILVAVGLVSGTITLLNERSSYNLVMKGITARATLGTNSLAESLGAPTKFGKFDLVEAAIAAMLKESAGSMKAGVVFGPDGSILAESGDSPAAALADLAKTAIASGETVRSPDGLSVARPISYGADATELGALATEWTSDHEMAQLRQEMVRVLLAAGGVFVLAALGALLAFSRIIARPLMDLRHSILSFARKDYDVAIAATTRGDEIGDIGKALDQLRHVLSDSAEVQRDAIFKSAALSASSASVMLTDETMTIRYMNPAMFQLFRKHYDALKVAVPSYDEATAIGSAMEGFHLSPDVIRKRLAQLKHDTFETNIRFGDAWVSLKVSAVLTDNAALAGYVLEWEDISESWLNKALITAIDANQIKAEFDIQGAVITANQPFLDAVKLTAAQMQLHSLHDLVVCDASETSAQWLRTVVENKAFIGKINLLGHDGGRVVVDGSLTCILDHKAAPIRFLLLGKDVTLAEHALKLAQDERENAEAQQTQVVDALRVGLRNLSNGDLTASIDTAFAASYEELRADYNGTLKNLAVVMGEISDNAQNIRNEARDISTTADGLSRRTESTAATLEQTAAALNELTTSVRAAAESAVHADQAVAEAKANAEESGQVVLATVSAMDQIADSSVRITSIIKVIDDIAFQTNLLALNAGVEAARAGDAGRGFAVVASEVRALAQRSSEAAREINTLIAKSGSQVKKGVDLVGKTGNALHQIVDSVSRISELVSGIAASSKQQSANLAEINNAVNQLDQSTQQNAARLEETTAASEALRNDAVALVQTVSHFKTSAVQVVHSDPAQDVPEMRLAVGQSYQSSFAAGKSTAVASVQSFSHSDRAAEKWEDF